MTQLITGIQTQRGMRPFITATHPLSLHHNAAHITLYYATDALAFTNDCCLWKTAHLPIFLHTFLGFDSVSRRAALHSCRILRD